MTAEGSAGGKVGDAAASALLLSPESSREWNHRHTRLRTLPSHLRWCSSSHDQNTEGLEDAGMARFRHHDVIHSVSSEHPTCAPACVCVGVNVCVCLHVYTCVCTCMLCVCVQRERGREEREREYPIADMLYDKVFDHPSH